jgi:uncharacterized membrane protein YgcG
MEFIPENRYQDLIVVDSTKGDEVYEVRVLRKWKVVDPSRSTLLLLLIWCSLIYM